MIHPDTYTKHTHKGLALFAKRDFRKGEILWVADHKTDKFLPAHYYHSLSVEQKEKIESLGYLDSRGRFVMPGDNGLYVNHSCDPNCTYLLEFDNISVAKRNISAGEEITEDYRCYHGHIESFDCECGAVGCTGYLDGNSSYQPSLRLSLHQIGGLVSSHHQLLLKIDFEHKKDFLQTLNKHNHGYRQPKNIFTRLVYQLQMELAVFADAH